MRRLSRDERLILQEASRIKKRLNEGGGAGVEFKFDETFVYDDNKIYGTLRLESYADASLIVAEDKPLGIIDIDEHALRSQIALELSGVDGELGVFEVTNVKLTNHMHGAGFSRHGFDGDLSPIAEIEVEYQILYPDGEEEWGVETLEDEVYIKFAPEVSQAYEALDDPDRYEYDDVDPEDYTYYVD